MQLNSFEKFIRYRMEILTNLYSKIWTLEEWLMFVDRTGTITSRLVLATDTELYTKLLKTTVVASSCEEELPTFSSFDQVSQQKELLLRVIQRIKRRNKKNVLTLGFSTSSDDIGAQVSHVHDLEYLYPNSCFNRLQYPVWCKLLSRIGDTVMEYLLTCTSMFIQVPNSSYVQLTGIPVFELWSFTPGKLYNFPPSLSRSGRKRKKNQTSLVKNKRKKNQTSLVKNKRKKSVENKTNSYKLTASETTSATNKKSDVVTMSPATHGLSDVLALAAEPKKLKTKKKKKKKLLCQEFSPYEYHTYINRIQILYANNLRERFNSNYILNKIPDTGDGALVLYRHILQHTTHVMAQKINLKWNFPEHSQNSTSDSSTCCDQINTSMIVFDNDEVEINDHHSFFGLGHTTDRLLVQQGLHSSTQRINSDDSSTCHSEVDLGRQKIKNGKCNEKANTKLRQLQNHKDSSSGVSLQNSETTSSSSSVICDSHISSISDSSLTISQGFETSGNLESVSKTECKDEMFTKLKNHNILLDSDFNQQFSSTPLEDATHDCKTTHHSKIDIGEIGVLQRKSVKRKFVEDDIDAFAKRPCFSSELSLSMSVHEQPCERIRNNTELMKGVTCCEQQLIVGCDKTVDGCQNGENDKVSRSLVTEIKNVNNINVGKDGKTLIRKDEEVIIENVFIPAKVEAILPEIVSDMEIPVGQNYADEVVCVYVDFIPMLQHLLQQILVKHRKCPYKSLLNYYCTAEGSQKKCQTFKRGNRYFGNIQLLRKNSIRENLHKFIPHKQVYLFIRKICLDVIPAELWGTKANRNNFLRNIWRMISLNKYDKFCIGQLMSGVKVGSISWLRNVRSNSVRQHIIAKLWYWIMEEFVIGIIKAFFYVTDTTQHVNRLFYYRKRTWQWLHIKALSGLLKRNIVKLIPESTAMKLVTERKSLGFATLRFFPKSKELRPIINLSKQQTLPDIPSIPINKQLLNLLQVMSLIRKNRPDIVGAAKFGLDEVYKVWKNYAVIQSKPLYFVKTDINNCYDEILQCKLFSIIKSVLSDSNSVGDEYLIRRYVKLVKEGGRIKRKFIRKAFQLGDFVTDFILFVKQLSQKESFHNVVFADQVVTERETREQVLRILHSHIFHNIIKIGHSFYQQNKGISQGSVVSTLLCNIYYGEMEKRFPVEDGELMMRIVDDGLFITPSKDRAMTYCIQMVTGLPEFNFSVNRNKVLTNFKCYVPGLEDIPFIDNTEWLSWCGILLRMRTLEATVNLSFYMGFYLKDSMTFDTVYRAGLTVKRKLFRSIALKCHPLYLDSKLNSLNVVVINIYKMFLLSACKYMQYMSQLSRRDNLCFLVNTVIELGHYFYHRYIHVLKYKLHGENGEVLSKNHIQWLCLHSYIVKLNHRRSIYKHVISVLQQHKNKLTKKLKDHFTAKQMEDVCDCELQVF